ncbi:hypothetical protein A7K93_11420 [Candidatus Methylacidiphilum fumarolicum]|uniref:Uncharacterized protein n=2 Tax=Candidatus Methylacidiphilum fumarolicum TaxID=591154 RepID=I0JWB9_METFB|nr:hypothetical protein A7K93_11420 [Candidatus Methylacidiphilum fumarolicum]TFE74835.1 hypothetical protein A7D33_11150 [Candidatus Methylacidiphilum fumarolicum]CAI9085621.1 conserved protein of unknown function [Candidatus Methylacidiphilum fumarolicum]CAI9085679.1 conserved protein of unknown function [Candidatus Methylacidiphilum fumarolicum]CCG91538.1 hypothetical protein MFUM_130002 [Methylacidiphilum fumariolicum SolV]
MNRFVESLGERGERDKLVTEDHASPNGLQDRIWKRALQDAYETVDKWLFVSLAVIGSKICRREGRTETKKRFTF